MTRILGAVLAGGRSRRFGSDKALAMVRGQCLLDHAIAALRAVTPDVVVCGRSWRGCGSLPDRPSADMGPLGGVNAALHHARAQGFDGVLTLACDTPFVAAPVLRSLIGAGRDAAYVAIHPVIGFWPSRHADALDAFLAGNGKHAVRGFADMVQAIPLDGDAEIANFNTAADLEDWMVRAMDEQE